MARSGNRFTSYLGVEIEPNTNSTLSQFERATERAFQRIEAFNNKGSSRLGIGGLGIDRNATASLRGTTTALSATRAEAARVAPALARVSAETNRASVGFTRASQSLSIVQGQLGPLAGRLGSLGTVFRDLAGISLAGVLGGAGAFALAGVATSYQKVTDRLRPFYDTQQQTNAAMSDVIKIARETRQALDPVAQLYSRLSQAGKDANLSFDVSRVSTTVAKAARLSGGDADTQNNGITQFLQGVGSGTLGGDELKSIRENTFRLAKAIADGLGVPIAKLKELGAAGKLTPQVVTEALSRASAQIDLEFSRLPKRIGASLTEAGNSLGIFIGRLDESSHATQGIAEAISALAGNLPAVITTVSGLAAVFAARSLATPIDLATASLSRFAATQAAVARGSATALTPRIQTAGKAAVVATRTRDDTLANATGIRSQQVAQQAALAALDARIAKETEAAAVQLAGQRAAVEEGQRGVILAQARVSAAEQELAVANQVAAVRRSADIDAARARVVAIGDEQRALASTRAAAQQRLIAAQQAGAAAATNPNLTRSARGRAVDTASRQQAVAEAELTSAMEAQAVATRTLTAAQAELATLRGAARTATQAQTIATQGLAAAEAELAAATGTAAAATTLGANAANNAAQRGIGLLAIQEQRIASNIALEATTLAANAATAASIPAIEAASVAQRALTAAQGFGARAGAVLSSGASKLSALLGGPVGIALTAATVGFTYLATRTNEAKEAGDRFVQAQAALQASLGGTTAALATQTAAARELTIALAEAGVEKAKQTRRAAGADLGASLAEASANIDLSTSQGRADFARTRQVSRNLANGVDSGITFKELNAIRNRNKGAFGNSAISSALGANPADTVIKAAGFIQTNTELASQQKALADARNAQNVKLKPIDLTGGKGTGRTAEQLKAEANDVAEGGTALAQARAKFNKTQADLDAELASRQKTGDHGFDDEYVRRLAAAKSELNAVGDGQRAAAAGAREHNKAIAAQNKELEAARGRAEKLAGIRTTFGDEPSAVKRGEKAKDAIDGLFTSIGNGNVTIADTVKVLNQETGKLEIYSRADAEKDKANIDYGVRRPLREALKDQEDELAVSRLILAGRSNEADVLRQKQGLLKSIDNLSDAEVAKIRNNAREQQKINDAIEKRNALIEIQVRAYGNVRDAVRDVIADPSGSTVKSVIARLQQQFKNDFADKFVLEIFGDPEKEARDAMTRGLNDSADNLTTAADNLNAAAEALQGLSSLDPSSPSSVIAGGSSVPLVSTAVAVAGAVIPKLGLGGDDSNKTFEQDRNPLPADQQDIVVMGRRKDKQKKDPVKRSTEETYNDAGKVLATKVFGSNSILTKGFSKLGTLLSGATQGVAANSIIQAGGKSKEATIGAGIGGALGKSLLGGKDGLFAKGLGAISSKLGSFAGPLGSIAGSVVGSVIGGLFKTNKQASSNVSVSASGVSSTTGVGKGSAERAAATGLGTSTAAGLQKIAEALGGSFGSSAVSIGYRPGHKDPAYRVDTTGQGKLTGVQAFETQQEAIQYAIIESLKQGAIKGIREGTKRLLAAGNDLDAALSKALRFEQVFKDLKAYTDPVGAAIDSLNTEFESLINLFNEAGASASEFADLQKLYDFKRADALKEATNSAVSSIQDFIDGLKNSSSSPLSRRTVYDNAKAKVEGFRGDLANGKTVDSDALLKALSDYQDASRELNGSRSTFYTDFEDILALAEKAKSNITAAQAGSSTLPASPFDPAVAGNIASTAQNTAQIVSAVRDMTQAFQANTNAIYGYKDDSGSTLNYLPSKRTA